MANHLSWGGGGGGGRGGGGGKRREEEEEGAEEEEEEEEEGGRRRLELRSAMLIFNHLYTDSVYHVLPLISSHLFLLLGCMEAVHGYSLVE